MLKKLLLTFVLILSTISFANAKKQSLFEYHGLASFYGPNFHGKKTANGEVFNQHALTAASNMFPFGSKLKVTCKSTGKSVIVRVNDTGGFGKYGRAIDLSKGAFSQIAPLSHGVIKVKIEKIN